MTEKATPLPQTGGSYTRDAKGALKQVEKPTAEQPIRTKAAPAAKKEA